MKLRNRLFLRICIVLFLQVSLSAGFTIITFYNQIQKDAEDKLYQAWRQAKHSIEMYKHRLYQDIYLMRFYLESMLEADFKSQKLNEHLYHFFTSTLAQRILIQDRNNRIIADVIGNPDGFNDIIHLLKGEDFMFPKNRFITGVDNQGDIQLFLVTGASFEREDNSLFYIFIISSIDNSMVESFSHEIGMNLAFFWGTNFICSANIPYFTIENQSRFNVFHINVSSVPYKAVSNIISTDIPLNLNLVVLKSELNDRIYIQGITTIFVIAFFLTLFAFAVIAVGITAQTIHPFSKLNIWLEKYMKKGLMEPLDIHTKDEIGFMANSFHNMVKKIIKEEKIIKDQLKKISFLNRYNELIVNNMQAGVIVVDDGGEILFTNPYFSTLIGSKPKNMLHKKVNEIFSKNFYLKDKEIMLNIDITKYSHIDNIQYRQNDGDIIRFVAKIIPLNDLQDNSGALIVLEDITKTERLWQKILASERINTLGIISAGMAHEINNPLGSILTHVKYLHTIERDKEKIDSLNWIESEGKRIAEIIQRVRTFSSKKEKNGVVNINGIIKETTKLLKLELEQKKIRLKLNLKQKGLNVKIDSNELKQTLLNILINSIQAIKNRGFINIITQNRDNNVILKIIDNGIGIKPENLTNIFDPFYTTKPANKGSGLGLSISYSIIKRAGGDIHVESSIKKGTEVDITLPLKSGLK